MDTLEVLLGGNFTGSEIAAAFKASAEAINSGGNERCAIEYSGAYSHKTRDTFFVKEGKLFKLGPDLLQLEIFFSALKRKSIIFCNKKEKYFYALNAYLIVIDPVVSYDRIKISTFSSPFGGTNYLDSEEERSLVEKLLISVVEKLTKV